MGLGFKWDLHEEKRDHMWSAARAEHIRVSINDLRTTNAPIIRNTLPRS